MNSRYFYHKTPKARRETIFAVGLLAVLLALIFAAIYEWGAALAVLPAIGLVKHPDLINSRKDAVNILSNLEVELDNMSQNHNTKCILQLIQSARTKISLGLTVEAIEALTGAQEVMFEAQIIPNTSIQDAIEKLHNELRLR